MIAQLNASCFMGQRIIIMSICCMGHKSGLYFLSWKNVDTSTFVNDFAHIMCHQNLLCYIRLKWCCWPSKVAILFLLRCLGLQGATFLHLILHNIFQMLDDGHDVCVCVCAWRSLNPTIRPNTFILRKTLRNWYGFFCDKKKIRENAPTFHC